MSTGLDPLTTGSINQDQSLHQHQRTGCFGNIVSYFSCRPPGAQHNEGGYVEFGEFHYENNRETQKVGTFNGVFCPVVLSMFSALVFIRMGFIIGNAGLLVTLMQFAISYIILIFTVCSVCAISTNGAIQGGGVYFMISRSLGPEFGGAIGTLFFFANVVSSALCFSACTEGLIENFGPSGYIVIGLPDGHWWRTLYGSLLAVVALTVNLAGARHFARTSLAIWSATTICLLSVILSFFIEKALPVSIPSSNKFTNQTVAAYTGLSAATLSENLFPDYGRDYSESDGAHVNFAVVFGVLFSGVTGVMAGANMSGELKNPSYSIPCGTLWAILFTGLTYLALSILTAATCSRDLLQNNYIYMMPVNVWPPFVTIGVLIATFSAGLSNMIGASRVLEALVKDNIFGVILKWCKRPWMCVLVAWLGAQLALLGGSLTAIARANCALFLLSYLAVNLACLALELAGAPNFRPTFRWFSWHSSLCGLLGALCMMFISASLLAAMALVLCLGLVIALHLASPAAAAAPWGSISQALIFHQVRKYLLLLDARKEHVKYWRPQLLLLVSNAQSAPPIARFANQLKKGGLLVLGNVIVNGNHRNEGGDCRQLPPVTPWLHLVDHLAIKAFVEQCSANNVREGARHLAHLSGLGAMKPNTVMLGFHDDELQMDFFSRVDSPWYSIELQNILPNRHRSLSGPAEYVALLADILAMDKGLCVCRHFQTSPTNYIERVPGVKYIDVWLTDFINPSPDDPFNVAGLFLLQMACILNTQNSWKKLKLRVMLTDTSLSGQGTVSNMSSDNSPSTEGLGTRTNSKQRLKELLNMLRIQATLNHVDMWTHTMEQLRENRAGKYDLSVQYVQGVNDMLRTYSSSETAVVFLYLPPPPEPSSTSTSSTVESSHHQYTSDEGFTSRSSTEKAYNPASIDKTNKRRKSQISSPMNNDLQQLEGSLIKECPDRLKYLALLKNFTDGLPPTIFVHGLKTVTSTAL